MRKIDEIKYSEISGRIETCNNLINECKQKKMGAREGHILLIIQECELEIEKHSDMEWQTLATKLKQTRTAYEDLKREQSEEKIDEFSQDKGKTFRDTMRVDIPQSRSQRINTVQSITEKFNSEFGDSRVVGEIIEIDDSKIIEQLLQSRGMDLELKRRIGFYVVENNEYGTRDTSWNGASIYMVDKKTGKAKRIDQNLRDEQDENTTTVLNPTRGADGNIYGMPAERRGTFVLPDGSHIVAYKTEGRKGSFGVGRLEGESTFSIETAKVTNRGNNQREDEGR